MVIPGRKYGCPPPPSPIYKQKHDKKTRKFQFSDPFKNTVLAFYVHTVKASYRPQKIFLFFDEDGRKDVDIFVGKQCPSVISCTTGTVLLSFLGGKRKEKKNMLVPRQAVRACCMPKKNLDKQTSRGVSWLLRRLEWFGTTAGSSVDHLVRMDLENGIA